MNINMTLLGQMITFLLFVLFTKKYVWPHLTDALAERQQKIADGLAAAERGHKDLEIAQSTAVEKIRMAKAEAMQIVDDAKKQATLVVENAKKEALEEGVKLREKTQADLEQMAVQAHEALRVKAAQMAILGAEKVLQSKIDQAANQELIESLVKEL